MPEEQLYLTLCIAVMKFQMEISKLLIVTGSEQNTFSVENKYCVT